MRVKKLRIRKELNGYAITGTILGMKYLIRQNDGVTYGMYMGGRAERELATEIMIKMLLERHINLIDDITPVVVDYFNLEHQNGTDVSNKRFLKNYAKSDGLSYGIVKHIHDMHYLNSGT